MHEDVRASEERRDVIALPQQDHTTSIIVRVPSDMKVVLRNWIVDGLVGVSHRVDAWEITVSADGKPSLVFYPQEPENYF